MQEECKEHNIAYDSLDVGDCPECLVGEMVDMLINEQALPELVKLCSNDLLNKNRRIAYVKAIECMIMIGY